MSTSRACTVVLFHAHPDDEALLTGGTMAGLASQGHRVVLVVATSGELGLADPGHVGLAERRREELARSAAVLGVARTLHLGYADSGSRPVPTGASTPADRFADADLADAARRLATVLQEESADILTVYDEHGGYGHPDHVQVHRVGSGPRPSRARRGCSRSRSTAPGSPEPSGSSAPWAGSSRCRICRTSGTRTPRGPT
ncbi:PIG-L deacetylase family protein [Nocardioides sp.]|uniref:PIG-L deacetylase family protein n=1 Tax=Nocardioides sp. TaxID=35761 RepID=UPI0037836255